MKIDKKIHCLYAESVLDIVHLEIVSDQIIAEIDSHSRTM
jgi:hypothetical protein